MDRWRRVLSCASSLWPGLPRLWRQASLVGLLEALTFAMLLQVAIVTTLIWPESIGATPRMVVCFCVVLFWLVFAAPVFWHSLTVLAGGFAVSTDDQRDDLFRDAQREYLRGEWNRAERLLTELLGMDAGDTDARLMLATLHRHAGQWQAAKEELDRVDASPDTDKWRFEVLQERLTMIRWKRRLAHSPEHRGDQDTELAADAA